MLVSTFHVIQSVPFQLGYIYTYNFSYIFFCCSLGILQREQEQSVVYGSVDSGNSISSHDKFLELVINKKLLISVSSKISCIFMVVYLPSATLLCCLFIKIKFVAKKKLLEL